MEIRKSKQYNQGIGKYKLLSSNAGVGSIIATKWGGFVMPLSSSLWDFVCEVSKYIEEHPNERFVDETVIMEKGVEIIKDSRFIDFLQQTEHLTNLKCFVAIPHIALKQDNTTDIENHPLNKNYQKTHSSMKGNLKEGMLTIPAIVFPRWFYSHKNYELKPVEEWLKIWEEKGCNEGKEIYFAPPRDPNIQTSRKHPKYENLSEGKDKIFGLLEQVSMVLICPNGHISDIPWEKYFCAKYNKEKGLLKEEFDLFDYDCSLCECEGHSHHNLQWLENRSHAESFGTLKCSNCGKSVSLEGIMNLKPLCPGERPWEGPHAHDESHCVHNNKRTSMQWALVTSNSVYYAENFSSLYIPECYLKEYDRLNEIQKIILELLSKWYTKYLTRNPDASKEEYLRSMSRETLLDKVDDSLLNIKTPPSAEDIEKVIQHFLPIAQKEISISDVRENYRFTEFSVFEKNSTSLSTPQSENLSFCDIDLPESLSPYFSKIQQVSTLGLTCTQINFARVQMPTAKLIDGRTEYPDSMKIFKGKPEDVHVMPANQTFGEGLFFSFNEEKIQAWIADNRDKLKEHYKLYVSHESMYDDFYKRLMKGGIEKFYLLHTFSHVLMKELEFSCGYPSASLSERLYFSERMCGVLIYTADGSDGSMGGLVWQGQPQLIENTIISALQRALNCASDPICWENDDQLNHAACFSCAMVSETSCEERNLGLDRRALVDEEFGFFQELIGY